jgi:cystathionine beta-lyase/cystathionine gamma-synthase
MTQLDIKNTIKLTLENMPTDWLRLTTHRLDIYNEALAKVEFLQKFEEASKEDKNALATLPTAFDYIRLGHPLSCVLEWVIAKELEIPAESVISFSSQVMPLMAVLRKNKFLKKKTTIVFQEHLPHHFNEEVIKSIYDYEFKLLQVEDLNSFSKPEGSIVILKSRDRVIENPNANFILNLCSGSGSVIQVLDGDDQYIKEIQHVRRRESVAMTPQCCLNVLKEYAGGAKNKSKDKSNTVDTSNLLKTISDITSTTTDASVGNCGLSVQYATMMGLVHYAQDYHPGQRIKFIVPPNCYGGTNDQARRVAACLDHVEIVDLPVDSGKDMVNELERILNDVAKNNEVPFIIAEIPTNPRVEIPDLEKLRETLKKVRKTNEGKDAIVPVLMLDQTFCPNVKFFGTDGYLHDAKTISYVSGSKFPSGGLCTAGYCVANESASDYMSYVQNHLSLCDNTATDLQIQILTEEMPSMNERITGAYKNTRGFVDFIQEKLPEAKINFVSHELADATFTPSVFSLDLPTKGSTHEEKEAYKQELNHKLIRMMIDAIPDESKHCVSYGQLKGCYWTIPATSTQGTTKESDKDYIVRVSVAADFDLEKHKQVFDRFCSSL